MDEHQPPPPPVPRALTLEERRLARLQHAIDWPLAWSARASFQSMESKRRSRRYFQDSTLHNSESSSSRLSTTSFSGFGAGVSTPVKRTRAASVSSPAAPNLSAAGSDPNSNGPLSGDGLSFEDEREREMVTGFPSPFQETRGVALWSAAQTQALYECVILYYSSTRPPPIHDDEEEAEDPRVYVGGIPTGVELAPADWAVIGQQLGRNPYGCYLHWFHALCPTVCRGAWLPDERRVLVAAAGRLGHPCGKDWASLSMEMSTRLEVGCRTVWDVFSHYRRMLLGTNGGPMTAAEEEIVRSMSARTKDKFAIAATLGTRPTSVVRFFLRNIRDREIKQRMTLSAQHEARLLLYARAYDKKWVCLVEHLGSSERGLLSRYRLLEEHGVNAAYWTEGEDAALLHAQAEAEGRLHVIPTLLRQMGYDRPIGAIRLRLNTLNGERGNNTTNNNDNDNAQVIHLPKPFADRPVAPVRLRKAVVVEPPIIEEHSLVDDGDTTPPNHASLCSQSTVQTDDALADSAVLFLPAAFVAGGQELLPALPSTATTRKGLHRISQFLNETLDEDEDTEAEVPASVWSSREAGETLNALCALFGHVMT